MGFENLGVEAEVKKLVPNVSIVSNVPIVSRIELRHQNTWNDWNHWNVWNC
jgi:hypothetical protein